MKKTKQAKQNKANLAIPLLFLFIGMGLLLAIGLFLYFRAMRAEQNTLKVRIHSQKTNENAETITIEYPQFPTVKPLSERIENDMTSEIKNFQSQVTENKKVRQDATYSLIIRWQPKQLNTNVISLIIFIDSYTGGANGTSTIRTYNYNVIKGKDISLSELVPGGGYLQTLSAFALTDLQSQFKEKQIPMSLLTQGTEPKVENFSYFTFDTNEIDLYFPKSQVAPGYAGMQEVVYPREATPVSGSMTLANPASVNCVNKGGQVTFKEGPNGTYGICVFLDNRQCEEWALMQGKCPVGGLKVTGYITEEATYCAIRGGTYTSSTDTCNFQGKSCAAQAYYKGDCSIY